MTVDPLGSKFWQRVDRRGESDCWEWVGTINGWGYGHYYDRRLSLSPRRAHRVAYEALVGPIPAGLTIDHLCRNRRCVNPAHLEPVTIRENVLRGDSPIARQARQTHCKYGHEFTSKNTRIRSDGARECIACDPRRARARNARKRERRAALEELEANQ